jgi:hypothetical protein
LRECALVASPQPKASALEPQQYQLFEAELQDGGRVRSIDLMKRARELGCLEDFETPVEHWLGNLLI